MDFALAKSLTHVKFTSENIFKKHVVDILCVILNQFPCNYLWSPWTGFRHAGNRSFHDSVVLLWCLLRWAADLLQVKSIDHFFSSYQMYNFFTILPIMFRGSSREECLLRFIECLVSTEHSGMGLCGLVRYFACFYCIGGLYNLTVLHQYWPPFGQCYDMVRIATGITQQSLLIRARNVSLIATNIWQTSATYLALH